MWWHIPLPLKSAGIKRPVVDRVSSSRIDKAGRHRSWNFFCPLATHWPSPLKGISFSVAHETVISFLRSCGRFVTHALPLWSCSIGSHGTALSASHFALEADPAHCS